jgi:hypothetical protein
MSRCCADCVKFHDVGGRYPPRYGECRAYPPGATTTPTKLGTLRRRVQSPPKFNADTAIVTDPRTGEPSVNVATPDDGEEIYLAAWPVVRETDWCGAWDGGSAD